MVTVVEYLSAAVKGKPIDGSDVKTLQEARSELTRLRRVAYRVCDILNKTTVSNVVIEKEKEKKKFNRQAQALDASYQTYEKVVVPKSEAVRELLIGAVEKNPLFKGWTKENMSDIVDVFAPKNFPAGSTVIKQGDKGDTFYVVESGSLDIYVNMATADGISDTLVGVPYGPGMGFGELALIYNSPRAATIKTEDECLLWEITRTAFNGLRFQHEKKAHELKLSSLRNVTIGSKVMGEVLSARDLESMALAVNYQQFSKGEVIIREGEKGDVMYFITEGSVEVSKQGEKLACLGVNKYFGEKALLSSEVRNATCIAEEDVECLTLLRDDFVLLLGDLDKILAGTRKKFKPMASFANVKETSFSMEDLEKGGVLGEGAFGKVNVVTSKSTGKVYALKAQSKAFLVSNGQESHTIGEYQLLRELNHVFIVKIYQALQDNRYVYFLMDLLPGGELMDLLVSKMSFKESWTRFYSASVLSAFKKIHEKNIAYRDLKPENLVLDAKGYCYVIDFGLAKKVDKGKTWTFCGTPDYLAPEIIRGKGHDWGVDYWGLGILVYELTHGYPPFYADDPTKTARNIIKGTFKPPSRFSAPLVDLIRKLLAEQSKRLGRTQGGTDEVIKHEWFSGFDWDSLHKMKMSAPYQPNVGPLEKLGKKEYKAPLAPISSWHAEFDMVEKRVEQMKV